MTDTRSRFWSRMSPRDRRALAGRDAVAVLPLAATEQHGPHLPLTTDSDINRGLLEHALTRTPADLPVAVCTPIDTGASDEHLDDPKEGSPGQGTVSIGSDGMKSLILREGRKLTRAGVRRLVLHNTHGGNRHAMAIAALELRRRQRMLVVSASWFRFGRPHGVDLPESEWSHGLHGGAVETAMMLHLHPDRVRIRRIRRFASFGEELDRGGSTIGPEGAAPFAWTAWDLNPNGVVGDATLATPAMGRRLVEHYGATLAAVIRDAGTFPLDRLA